MPNSKVDHINSFHKRFNGIVKEAGGNHIRGIGLGWKTVNGIRTETPSIVFHVKKKLPLSELQPQKTIPKTLNIDGIEYKTDIIENTRTFKLNSYGCYGINYNSYAQPHRVSFRWTPTSGNPIQGGISVNQNEGGTGTLGAIVWDRVNNKLCGLSNVHVFAEDPFLASEKSILIDYGYPIFRNNTKDKGVVQPGEGSGPFFTPPTFSKQTGIGYVKRYVPLYFWNWNSAGEFVYKNLADAAITSLIYNTTYKEYVQLSGQAPIETEITKYIVFQDSSKQFNMTFTDITGSQPYYPFASTEEIDSVDLGDRVWKSGRTTGFVGKDECQLEIIEKSSDIDVYGYTFSSFQTYVTFSDCFRFAYKLVNNETIPRPAAILGGDSGSVLIADFNGIKKIIGLNFAGGRYNELAGDGSAGYACRIDHVQDLLNITHVDTSIMFDPNNLNNDVSEYFDNPQQWKYITEPGLSNQAKIATGLDQEYYQCGIY